MPTYRPTRLSPSAGFPQPWLLYIFLGQVHSFAFCLVSEPGRRRSGAFFLFTDIRVRAQGAWCAFFLLSSLDHCFFFRDTFSLNRDNFRKKRPWHEKEPVTLFKPQNKAWHYPWHNSPLLTRDIENKAWHPLGEITSDVRQNVMCTFSE